jgi:hypothetical protein
VAGYWQLATGKKSVIWAFDIIETATSSLQLAKSQKLAAN